MAQYYNVRQSQCNLLYNGGEFIESAAMTNEEAIQEILDHGEESYLYTIEIDNDSLKKIDLRKDARGAEREVRDQAKEREFLQWKQM